MRERTRADLSVLMKAMGVFFFLVLSSCYEGRNRSTMGGGPGGGGGPPTTPDYYFILFEPILLSQEAMNTPGCFLGPSSERTYRLIEWKARIKLLTEGLKSQSEHFAFNPTYVNAEGCRSLVDIEKRASMVLTPNSNWPTDPDDKGRLSLHLKAIFWDRDVYPAYPSNSVASVDWMDVHRLRAQGINTISLHYIVYSNPLYGYFMIWSWHLPEASYLLNTGIASPDPSDQGPKTRTARILSDTSEFFDWLKGAAHDLAPRSKQ